jgi:type II secretory pathway pseudopilin PulG
MVIDSAARAGQKRTAPESAGTSRLDDRGYILAVLLIGMAISAVWLSASLPAWRQQAQRQKELELVFRGEQYSRAIALFFAKNNTFPTDIDTLVSQHYLRKKWKDPITNDDFATVLVGQAAPGSVTTTQSSGRGGPGVSAPAPQTAAGRGTAPGSTSAAGQFSGGGIQGVISKSKATSIRLYGQTQAQEYDLWYFDCNSAMLKIRGGGCTPQQPGQNGRGGPTGGLNGRGNPTGINGPNGRNGQPGQINGPNRNGGPGGGGPVGPTGPVGGGTGRGRGGR